MLAAQQLGLLLLLLGQARGGSSSSSIIAASGTGAAEATTGDDASSSSSPCGTVAECLVTSLWHIPVNPIISPRPAVDGKPDWQSSICEVAGGITKSNGTYYLLYHCLGNGDYSSGASTAAHPLGPWTKTAEAPLLQHGPCLNILQDPQQPSRWIGCLQLYSVG